MNCLLIDGGTAGKDPGRDALRAAAGVCEAAGGRAELFWPVRTKDLVCSGCGACRGAGMCVHDPRGMEFVKAAGSSDALIFAVPVGLFGASVDVRNLLQRAAEIAARCKTPPMEGKRAAVLLYGRRSGAPQAEKQLRALLKSCGLKLSETGGVSWLPAGEESEAAAAAAKACLTAEGEEET